MEQIEVMIAVLASRSLSISTTLNHRWCITTRVGYITHTTLPATCMAMVGHGRGQPGRTGRITSSIILQ
jgi:hypothetical protein